MGDPALKRPVSARAKRFADDADRHRRNGRLAAARADLDRALAIIERGPGWGRSPLTRLRWARAHADLLCGVGEVSMEQGRPDLARDALEQALREYAELSHPESADTATVLNNLGVVYEKLGLLDESDRVLRRAMEINEKIRAGSAAIAANLNNISLISQAKGYPEEADLALEGAAQLAGLPPGTIARLDRQRSFHLATRGDYARAVVAITEQLDEVEPGTIDQAFLLGDLAQTYAAMHRWPDAERWHRREIDLRRRLQPGSLPLAIAMTNYSNTLDELGRDAEAEAAVSEAVKLAERIAPHSAALAAVRSAQAWRLLVQGRPADVVALASATVAAAPQARRQLAGVWLAAVAAYRQLGRPELAREWLVAARDACAWIRPAPPELRVILTALGDLLLAAKDCDGAAECFDGAIRVAEDQRVGSAAEPGLESIFGTAEAAYHGRIDVADRRRGPGDVEAAFRAMEGFRARTLAELLSDTERRPSPAAAATLAELDRVRAELGALYRRAELNQSAQTDDGRVEREQVAERLRLRLRALDPATADRDYPAPCEITEIQACLDEETSLVIYEVTSDAVFRCTIGQRTVDLLRLSASAAEIGAAADEVLAACRDRSSEIPAQALERLGRWLLDALPATARKLAVCANGVLSYLPFEALTVGGVPCVEQRVVWSVPSATTVVRFGAASPRQPASAFVGFAVPDAEHLSPLPSVVGEAETIADGFAGDSLVLVGGQVTGAAVREAAPRGRFVHFAAHGLIDDERPLFSGFPLPGQGFLAAYELAALRLSADLVSCSACETAVGAARPGEGVVGLAYALFGAGARAVLVSRWEVSDRVARRVMIQIYRDLAAGTPVALAVQAAVQRERRRQPHPREWAAFTLIALGMPGEAR